MKKVEMLKNDIQAVKEKIIEQVHRPPDTLMLHPAHESLLVDDVIDLSDTKVDVAYRLAHYDGMEVITTNSLTLEQSPQVSITTRKMAR